MGGWGTMVLAPGPAPLYVMATWLPAQAFLPCEGNDSSPARGPHLLPVASEAEPLPGRRRHPPSDNVPQTRSALGSLTHSRVPCVC